MNKKVIIAIVIVVLVPVILFSYYIYKSYNSYANNKYIDKDHTTFVNYLLPEDREQSEEKYTVKDGDTLESIASEYGLKQETIVWANDLTDMNITSGQTLVIPPQDGIYVTVKDGDTLQSLSSEYGIDAQAIADFNWLDSNASLKAGDVIFLPSATK